MVRAAIILTRRSILCSTSRKYSTQEGKEQGAGDAAEFLQNYTLRNFLAALRLVSPPVGSTLVKLERGHTTGYYKP